MPSNRSRSRSRDRPRDKDRDKERSKSRSPRRRVELPEGASPISESDYFQKSDEFRLWLKDEKRKYFDELSGEKARSYFRKFVKAWNKGKLPNTYYKGLEPGSIAATINTAYQWTFASKSNRAENEALRATREQVGAATYARSIALQNETEGASSSRPSGPNRVQGPTLPSAADLTLARELNSEHDAELRTYKRKRDKLEAKARIEDMVGPREVGKEAMLEKKRMRRENDKAFRDGGDEGLEIDESTLMGGGDSFQAQIAKRNAAKNRRESKNSEEKILLRERATAVKEKEKATMDMFQQLAKQRFG